MEHTNRNFNSIAEMLHAAHIAAVNEWNHRAEPGRTRKKVPASWDQLAGTEKNLYRWQAQSLFEKHREKWNREFMHDIEKTAWIHIYKNYRHSEYVWSARIIYGNPSRTNCHVLKKMTQKELTEWVLKNGGIAPFFQDRQEVFDEILKQDLLAGCDFVFDGLPFDNPVRWYGHKDSPNSVPLEKDTVSERPFYNQYGDVSNGLPFEEAVDAAKNKGYIVSVDGIQFEYAHDALVAINEKFNEKKLKIVNLDLLTSHDWKLVRKKITFLQAVAEMQKGKVMTRRPGLGYNGWTVADGQFVYINSSRKSSTKELLTPEDLSADDWTESHAPEGNTATEQSCSRACSAFEPAQF